MLVGLRSPVILVPEWMRTIEDGALVRQVLTHEMAHLERGDHWTNVFLQWAGGMLWMHPLYYWMRRRILMLREVICDIRVLEDFDPLSYSETLLNLARQSSVRRWESAALGVATPKSLLGRRITFLLNHSPKQQPGELNNVVRRCAWSAALLIPFASGLIQVQAAPKSMDPSVVELQGDGVQEVHGTVQLPDGKPAKGAKVHLFRTGDGAMTLPVKTETAETDLEGKYRYRNLAVGTYLLWAETDQLTSLNEKLRGTKIEIKERQPKAIVTNFTLHEGCRYEVTVWDKEKDVAVPGADIYFGWTDIDRHYKTNQNGFVEIGGLAIDEWYFVVKAKGYGIQYRKLPKQPLGSRTRIRFDLESGTDLQGTIRDESGAPVAGARIGATESQGGMNPGYGRTESDAEGKFQLPSIPRGTEIRLSATAEGYLRLSTSVNVPSDLSQLRSDLVMTKRPYGGDCLVKVLNDQGAPISNAKIENMGSSSADVRTATTNEDGVARVNDLYASVLGSNGTVRAAGYIAAQVKLIAGTKEKPGEVTVRLKKGASFRGRLVKPNGEPAPRVWVFYNQGESGFGGLGGRVDTDAEGRFQIDGLPNPSTFTIYTPAPYAPIQGRSLPVGSKEEIEIKMEPEGVIRVRAIDKETGKAIPEFNVRIGFSQDRRPNEPRVTLNSELFDPGKNILGDTKVYRLGQLVPGFGLQLTVSAKGYQKKVLPRLEASIEADSDIVDVELNREDESMFCVVSGRLVDTNGKPVSGALLKLVIGKNKDEGPESVLRRWSMITSGQVERDPACIQLLTTTTKSDGSFRFDRVIDGNWKELIHTGGKVASGRFVLRPSDNRSGFEDLNLEAKRSGIVRVVIDRDKFPKVDAIELSASQDINSVGNMNQTVTAGVKELTFEDVAPGSYRVSLCERSADVGGFFTQKVIKSLQVELKEGEDEEVQFR